ncbi:FAD:protein FMN transferase [Bifidobacterium margollesii]|nr:FAD:protein FMN transferase [Bifidobacterium margollesii]
MSTSPNRFSHITAFPNALGTGMIISSSQPIDDGLHGTMATAIESFEAAFSRFRDDSLVGRIAHARHGGDFVFPDPQTAESLFTLYDQLFAASGGAIDPTVGEELTRLGYDARLVFRMDREPEYQPDHDHPAAGTAVSTANRNADHAEGDRSTWDSITHTNGTISTTRPVRLDFGAAGKGMMVDLLGRMIERELPDAEYVVDAGGDLRVRADSPIRVALEDPDDPSRAVGVAEIGSGAFCASAPSRRHWRVRFAEGAVNEVHHLLDARDGRPASEVKATWVHVPTKSTGSSDEQHPTALADGLATALFVTDPAILADRFTNAAGTLRFQCALMQADRTVAASSNFPADFFTA